MKFQDKDKSLFSVDGIDEQSMSENVALLRQQTDIFNKYSFTRVQENHLPIEYYKNNVCIFNLTFYKLLDVLNVTCR